MEREVVGSFFPRLFYWCNFSTFNDKMFCFNAHSLSLSLSIPAFVGNRQSSVMCAYVNVQCTILWQADLFVYPRDRYCFNWSCFGTFRINLKVLSLLRQTLSRDAYFNESTREKKTNGEHFNSKSIACLTPIKPPV